MGPGLGVTLGGFGCLLPRSNLQAVRSRGPFAGASVAAYRVCGVWVVFPRRAPIGWPTPASEITEVTR